MSTEFYATLAHRHTGVYVDRELVASWDHNTAGAYEREQEMKASMIEHGMRFVERVVFGHGRSALVFISAPGCAWFAACDNVSTGTKSHPIIGEVPICDRCRARVDGPADYLD